MKFTVNSKTLLDKLQILGAIIPNNPTLPIIENFLFEFSTAQLDITATDLETTIRSSIDITSGDDGSVALPAKILIELLKAFPTQPVTFQFNKNSTVEIASESGNYVIAYSEGDAFPSELELENPATVELPAKVLAEAISKTSFATGTDDLRPTMTGVFIKFYNKGIDFVATDAHKLAKYTRLTDTANEEASFIIPRKPLGTLKSILSTSTAIVAIQHNQSNVRFNIAEYTVTCRLIDGKYPNYEAVIPKDNPNVITIDRQKLLSSIKCVSLFSTRTSPSVKFSMRSNELNIHSEDIDRSNKGDEQLVCNYSGEEFEIGFNARFLVEMLSILQSDDVTIEMSLPGRAGILKPADRLQDGESIMMLIMPIQLNA